LIIGLISIVFCSCERTIEFKLEQSEPKLVVEATIESGQYPVVVLSNSLNYFSSIDVSAVANSFVHGADVTVSNGTVTNLLREYAIPLGGGYSYYYYTYNSSSSTPPVVGELNKDYSLRIVVDGKEYRAVTHIPDTTKRIDSLFWKPAPAGNPPDRVAVMVRAKDRPGFGDYIRYFTRRNHEIFYPGLNSVYDDQVIDGSEYEVQVERGVDRSVPHPEGFSFFFKGDTVTFKLCSIDKATYDFWRTMEFTYDNVGNPFASPTKVLSNIEGNALGYFGGYAAQFRTVIIPR
jgi:hypothetical protein